VGRKSDIGGTNDSTSIVRRNAQIDRFFKNRIRLSQLRVLAAIAELGQFRRVAEKLNVTPPAISKQVAEIADGLQLQIVKRLGNHAKFTPVGELLARRAKEILLHVDRTRLEIEDLAAGKVATIGVGIVPTVAPLFLPTIISNLKRRAPDVSIRVFENHFAELAPLLKEGLINIVLARETTHVLAEHFVEKEVMQDPVLICCAMKYRPKKRGRLTWDDLRGWPWLVPRKDTPTYVYLESLLFRHGLAFGAGSIESNSRNASAGILQAHPFLALLSRSYAQPLCSAGVLYEVPLSTEGMLGTIKLVWDKVAVNPYNSIIIDAVQERLSVVQSQP